MASAPLLRAQPLRMAQMVPFVRASPSSSARLISTSAVRRAEEASSSPASRYRQEEPPGLMSQAMGPLLKVILYSSAMYLALHGLWNSLNGEAQGYFRAAIIEAKQEEVRAAVLEAKASLQKQKEYQQAQASKSWLRRTLHF